MYFEYAYIEKYHLEIRLEQKANHKSDKTLLHLYGLLMPKENYMT